MFFFCCLYLIDPLEDDIATHTLEKLNVWIEKIRDLHDRMIPPSILLLQYLVYTTFLTFIQQGNQISNSNINNQLQSMKKPGECATTSSNSNNKTRDNKSNKNGRVGINNNNRNSNHTSLSESSEDLSSDVTDSVVAVWREPLDKDCTEQWQDALIEECNIREFMIHSCNQSIKRNIVLREVSSQVSIVSSSTPFKISANFEIPHTKSNLLIISNNNGINNNINKQESTSDFKTDVAMIAIHREVERRAHIDITKATLAANPY